jgi:hypothetical protein
MPVVFPWSRFSLSFLTFTADDDDDNQFISTTTKLTFLLVEGGLTVPLPPSV